MNPSFDRIYRLIGPDGLKALEQSSLLIVGLGGVGSWAAESLVRSGIGQLTLVDYDTICVTNINRQLHATSKTTGQIKSHKMKARLLEINPDLNIKHYDTLFSEANALEILNSPYSYVLDCIDTLEPKVELIYQAKLNNIKIISSLGAAAKLDPLQIKISDLAKTHTDPMAVVVRKRLRARGGPFLKKTWEIPSVFSPEKAIIPFEGMNDIVTQAKPLSHFGLRKTINGSISHVTGAFGLHMAGWVIQDLLKINNINLNRKQ